MNALCSLIYTYILLLILQKSDQKFKNFEKCEFYWEPKRFYSQFECKQVCSQQCETGYKAFRNDKEQLICYNAATTSTKPYFEISMYGRDGRKYCHCVALIQSRIMQLDNRITLCQPIPTENIECFNVCESVKSYWLIPQAKLLTCEINDYQPIRLAGKCGRIRINQYQVNHYCYCGQPKNPLTQYIINPLSAVPAYSEHFNNIPLNRNNIDHGHHGINPLSGTRTELGESSSNPLNGIAAERRQTYNISDIEFSPLNRINIDSRQNSNNLLSITTSEPSESNISLLNTISSERRPTNNISDIDVSSSALLNKYINSVRPTIPLKDDNIFEYIQSVKPTFNYNSKMSSILPNQNNILSQLIGGSSSSEPSITTQRAFYSHDYVNISNEQLRNQQTIHTSQQDGCIIESLTNSHRLHSLQNTTNGVNKSSISQREQHRFEDSGRLHSPRTTNRLLQSSETSDIELARILNDESIPNELFANIVLRINDRIHPPLQGGRDRSNNFSSSVTDSQITQSSDLTAMINIPNEENTQPNDPRNLIPLEGTSYNSEANTNNNIDQIRNIPSSKTQKVSDQRNTQSKNSFTSLIPHTRSTKNNLDTNKNHNTNQISNIPSSKTQKVSDQQNLQLKNPNTSLIPHTGSTKNNVEANRDDNTDQINDKSSSELQNVPDQQNTQSNNLNTNLIPQTKTTSYNLKANINNNNNQVSKELSPKSPKSDYQAFSKHQKNLDTDQSEASNRRKHDVYKKPANIPKISAHNSMIRKNLTKASIKGSLGTVKKRLQNLGINLVQEAISTSKHITHKEIIKKTHKNPKTVEAIEKTVHEKSSCSMLKMAQTPKTSDKTFSSNVIGHKDYKGTPKIISPSLVIKPLESKQKIKKINLAISETKLSNKTEILKFYEKEKGGSYKNKCNTQIDIKSLPATSTPVSATKDEDNHRRAIGDNSSFSPQKQKGKFKNRNLSEESEQVIKYKSLNEISRTSLQSSKSLQTLKFKERDINTADIEISKRPDVTSESETGCSQIQDAAIQSDPVINPTGALFKKKFPSTLENVDDFSKKNQSNLLPPPKRKAVHHSLSNKQSAIDDSKFRKQFSRKELLMSDSLNSAFTSPKVHSSDDQPNVSNMRNTKTGNVNEEFVDYKRSKKLTEGYSQNPMKQMNVMSDSSKQIQVKINKRDDSKISKEKIFVRSINSGEANSSNISDKKQPKITLKSKILDYSLKSNKTRRSGSDGKYYARKFIIGTSSDEELDQKKEHH